MSEDDPNLFEKKKHWYFHWWGVVVVIVLFSALTLAIVIGMETYKIYEKIKRGEYVPPTNESTEEVREVVSADDDPFQGPIDAPVVIIAFEDFACPYCKDSFMPVKQLLGDYENEVRFVFRDFPVEALHPEAMKAHLAAECAHDQGKFWEYHDKLFLNQGDFTMDNLVLYAKEVGLDLTVFTPCLDNETHIKEIQKDLSDGVSLDISGTPVWFFNGLRVEGSLPLEAFKLLVDRELEILQTENSNQ